jgi:predicted Rossmann fold nucleotide-binding protein DprA/Smf involved in DNA uptake
MLPLGNTPLKSIIIGLIQGGIRDGDELQLRTKVSASEFSQALAMMEITGSVRALGGNQWTLK